MTLKNALDGSLRHQIRPFVSEDSLDLEIKGKNDVSAWLDEIMRISSQDEKRPFHIKDRPKVDFIFVHVKPIKLKKGS